ncbi:MAG: ATP-binding cassette domain-containing protein [Propionibacteriaceae bacterium]|nr:ATP-binding cassette domain-containing protein [Propionibacteriaceae bacterium]
MITVENLTKTYGDFKAVDDLSFMIEDGSLFAFLGTNGAGKTTTLSCLTTLLEPDAGRIAINGHLVGRDDHVIRTQIGIVFQESLLDPELTVRENLALRAVIYGGEPGRIAELAELVDLKGFIDRRYGLLSGGEKRRVDIARALFHEPATLFLDEPTTGLDPASREQVWEAITGLRETLGLTVLLTTHYMHETEAADYVLVIDHGRKLASGTPMALRAAHSKPRLTIKLTADNRELVLASLAQHAPEAEIWEEGGAVQAELAGSGPARAIIRDLGEALGDFQFVQGSMDDVFLNLTSQREAA